MRQRYCINYVQGEKHFLNSVISLPKQKGMQWGNSARHLTFQAVRDTNINEIFEKKFHVERNWKPEIARHNS